MSKPLKNPELPPGEIVATHEDDKDLSKGQVRRNDGKVLNPASQNPWYVLATVAGEQEEMPLFDDVFAKNRRFWNGWMCQDMDDTERAVLAKMVELPEAELAPLSSSEWNEIHAKFESALPQNEPWETAPPDPSDPVDFTLTHFPKSFVLDQFLFVGDVSFQDAHFAGGVSFRNGHFSERVLFQRCEFSGPVHFEGTHFIDNAFFHDATFYGDAFFQSARFHSNAEFPKVHFVKEAWFKKTEFYRTTFFPKASFWEKTYFGDAFFKGNLDFSQAHFTGDAYFKEAQFHKGANFSDGSFKARTVFDGAAFKGAVPKFFHREMHQDTGFSDETKLWPEVTAENAKAGKRAYTRLRQVAAEIYDPDLEHFFLRQEMKCKEALAGRFEKGLFVLYRKLADSGISVKRPAAFLAGLWAFGAALFWGYFLAPMGHDVPPSVAASPGWSGIGLSFANVFAFLGLSRAFFADVLADLPMCLKYFAGLQTVFGAVFFFLLALGLRNRFRLK